MPADLTLQQEGYLLMLYARSERAKKWITAAFDTSDDAVAVEQGYEPVKSLLVRIKDAGLSVQDLTLERGSGGLRAARDR